MFILHVENKSDIGTNDETMGNSQMARVYVRVVLPLSPTTVGSNPQFCSVLKVLFAHIGLFAYSRRVLKGRDSWWASGR